MKDEKIILISILLILISIISIAFSKTLALIINISENILESLFTKMIFISVAYLSLRALIIILFPSKLFLEEIFTGGVSKPPYIAIEEILNPKHLTKTNNKRGLKNDEKS